MSRLSLLALVFGMALLLPPGSWHAKAPASRPALAPLSAVGTAFTYQGRLTEGDLPADGPHDLRFILYDADAGGSQVGETLLLEDVGVEDGLFTVALDFGDVFGDRARWLEVSVRPGASEGAFTPLHPRQPLTPAPFAIRAGGAWSLGGNTELPDGTFLGTTDERPLVLKTGGQEALRVSGAGNVGIGTVAPEVRLEVRTDSSLPAIQAHGVNRAIIGRLGGAGCIGNHFALAGCAGSTGGVAVRAESTSGIGVLAVSGSSVAVAGTSDQANAIEGRSTAGIGVLGNSTTRGVVGTLGAVSCPGSYAVGGCADAETGVVASSSSGTALLATSSSGSAVVGRTTGGIGVHGDAAARGVVGTLGRTPCPGAYAVGGCAGSTVAAGVYGRSDATVGVMAHTVSGDLFRGVIGPNEIPVARISATGRGYFNGGTQTGGADYAEAMPASEDLALLEPGDVLALDPATPYAVRRSAGPASPLVAGVYSTRPSILAVGERSIDDPLTDTVPVALLGIVPTKVSAESGPIAVGDLLVSASLPGHAMKAVPRVVDGVPIHATGAILGKAMEPLEAGTGRILVLVTLR